MHSRNEEREKYSHKNKEKKENNSLKLNATVTRGNQFELKKRCVIFEVSDWLTQAAPTWHFAYERRKYLDVNTADV